MSASASGSSTLVAGVIGLGYVGLPLGVTIAQRGLRAIGFDVAVGRVANINRGISDIDDIPSSVLAPLVASGKLVATTDMSRLSECDLISICVPTPLSKTRDPDISYIIKAVEQVAANLRPGQTIVLESTTYPGTTSEAVQPKLEAGGLKAGKDFFLAFSPERVDPGRKEHTTINIPKVVGGVTAACTKRAAELYGLIFERVVEVSSAATAEMAKLLENTFRQVNIGLINEVAQICQRLGISVWEVVDAAATKPFGFMPFYPGPGLGGHCIPVDPHYLAWKMRSLNYTTRFIELASTVNLEMPRYVVERVAEALNEIAMPLNGANVLVLGVAYKKNIADFRESPALDVVAELVRTRAKVSYCDPHVPHIDLHGTKIEMSSVPFDDARLAAADIVVILTDHAAFEPERILRNAKLVYDARNFLGPVLRKAEAEGRRYPCRVLRLGDGRLA